MYVVKKCWVELLRVNLIPVDVRKENKQVIDLLNGVM